MAELEEESLVINNSPIEFVIIGPRGSHDAVLVRTRDAKLDLIGFSSFEEDAVESDKACMQTVVPPPIRSDESRLLQFTFCVRALLDNNDLKMLNKEFDRRIIDIQLAIAEWDQVKLERALAPLIYKCNKVHLINAKWQRFRFYMRASIYSTYGVAAVTTIIVTIYEMIRRFLP